MDSRRSMGASKPWGLPKRNSAAGSGLQSTGKAQGGSRLPKPNSTQKMVRSSSIDNPGRRDTLGTKRAASATRSPSKNQTPMRSSRHLMPLSGANSGGSVRSSNYPFGRESMTPNHRESMMKVPVKDTRCINEKAWQIEKTRDLIDFCGSNNYQGTLSLSNFPLNSTEFKKVFTFLFRFLNPDFEMPRPQDMGLELPPLLKKVGYPGTVSKSMFQTIGTAHSWPMTLGVLHFLLLRIKVLTSNLGQGLYINLEDNTPVELARSQYDTFIDCYMAYMRGIDDYADEMDEFSRGVMQIFKIDKKVLDELKLKAKNYEAEFEELRSNTIGLDKLIQEKKDTEGDVKKLEDFIRDQLAILKARQDEYAMIEQKVEELCRKKQMLMSSITELERICKNEKGLNPDEAHAIEYNINDLKKQVIEKKNAVDSARAVLWKTEQALSNRNAFIDKLCQQFNLALMELKIESSVALRLDRSKPTDEIEDRLKMMLKELLNTEKSLKESNVNHESEFALLKQQLNRKLGEVKKSEAELKVRQEDHDNTIKKIETETAQLTAALEETKERVLKHSDRDKKDLKALEAEMEHLKTELKAAKEAHEKTVAEGVELVHKLNAAALEIYDKKIKEKDMALEKYKEKVSSITKHLVDLKRDVPSVIKSSDNQPL